MGVYTNDDRKRQAAVRGTPGITPHIGTNGNWFIGSHDTGVSAAGNLDRAITHVALSNNQLTFTHGDGAKHSIQLPQQSITPLQTELDKEEQVLAKNGQDVDALKKQLGDLSHNIQGLSGVYSYRGPTAPQDYPQQAKAAYIVNLSKQTSPLNVSLPPITPALQDGTLFTLNNDSESNAVNLTSPTGQSIQNATHLAIGPQQFTVLIKNGSNWEVVAQGYIPDNLTDLTHRITSTLTPQLHTNADINQLINNWIANPANHAVLDKILESMGYQHSGGTRPTATTIHIGIGQDYPANFDNEIGTYNSAQKLMVNNLDKNPAKVWIAVPESKAQNVNGISANGGLYAQWENKTINVSGEDWRVFISPTQLADQHIVFEIKWSL